MTVGVYVHHHGLGHRIRTTLIARRLRSEVVGFGSMPAPDGWPGEWVELPDDTAAHPTDPTAGGALHWAPIGHAGHRRRLGMLAEFLAEEASAMLVDVSAEVALLSRIMGVPTVVAAMRGDRADAAHRAAYGAATRLLAPWPVSSADPGWPAAWRAKTLFAGGISRFDELVQRHGGVVRTGPVRAVTSEMPCLVGGGPTARRPRTVLVLQGAGGRHDARALDAARAAASEWTWTVRTPDDPSPDLWRELAEAAVVVAHAGQNAVAEIAAARAPAIIVAQPRPFGEQIGTAEAVHRRGCAIGLREWPAPLAWPGLLARAAEAGGPGWEAWSTGNGADLAARMIDALAEPSPREERG